MCADIIERKRLCLVKHYSLCKTLTALHKVQIASDTKNTITIVVQDFTKNTDHLKRIYEIHLKSTKETKRSQHVFNRLHLETLRDRWIMPKNLPWTTQPRQTKRMNKRIYCSQNAHNAMVGFALLTPFPIHWHRIKLVNGPKKKSGIIGVGGMCKSGNKFFQLRARDMYASNTLTPMAPPLSPPFCHKSLVVFGSHKAKRKRKRGGRGDKYRGPRIWDGKLSTSVGPMLLL